MRKLVDDTAEIKSVRIGEKGFKIKVNETTLGKRKFNKINDVGRVEWLLVLNARKKEKKCLCKK
jgi:hypothetical protein